MDTDHDIASKIKSLVDQWKRVKREKEKKNPTFSSNSQAFPFSSLQNATTAAKKNKNGTSDSRESTKYRTEFLSLTQRESKEKR